MSVPDKQNSCCGDGDGTVHCLQVMTMCRTVPTARRPRNVHLSSCWVSVSGADKASPMEGVTGTMAGLGHVPRRPQRGS